MVSQFANRRSFLHTAGAAMVGGVAATQISVASALVAEPWFKIGLAQWSLHKAFFEKKLDPINFPSIAKKDFGLSGVEYVNQFYKGKAEDEATGNELLKQSKDMGVENILIMCDGEGNLGDSTPEKRKQAVKNHHKWVHAAKFLGCHSIRVNAASSGTYEEQLERAAEGLAALTEYGDGQGINVIVENHGGLSSNGAWLAAVIKKVNHPRCGTLPDFGNFNLGNGKTYDRYQGVEELMPFAKGVSAKSHDFDAEGNEKHTDYKKMLNLVRKAGYKGWVSVEWEGGSLSESEGIKATVKLLERVRQQLD